MEYSEKNRTVIVEKSFSFLDFDKISNKKFNLLNQTLKTKLTENQEYHVMNSKHIFELAEDISERNYYIEEIEKSDMKQMEHVTQLENQVEELTATLKGKSWNNFIFRIILISVTGTAILVGFYFIGRQCYIQRKYKDNFGNNQKVEGIPMGPAEQCGGWTHQ